MLQIIEVESEGYTEIRLNKNQNILVTSLGLVDQYPRWRGGGGWGWTGRGEGFMTEIGGTLRGEARGD